MLAFVLACGPAHAATAEGRASLGEQAIERRIAVVEQRKDLDKATRTRITGLYSQAIAEVQATRRLREETEDLRRLTSSAPEDIRGLERELQNLEREDLRTSATEEASLDQLEQRELQLRASSEGLQRKLTELDRSFEETATRPLEARRQQDELRGAIDAADASLRELARRSASSSLAEAEFELARARQDGRHAQLDRLTQELAYQPFLLRIMQLRRDLARIEVERAEGELRRVRELLEQRRLAAAEAARREAQRKREEAGLPAPLKEMEAGNAELRARIAESGLAIDNALREISARRTELAAIDTDLQLALRRAQLPGDRSGLGANLLRNLSVLPAAERYAKARQQRDALIRATTDDNVTVERDLAALTDIKTAAAHAIATSGPLGEEERPKLEADLRAQFAERRSQLVRLDNLQDELVRTLREAEEAELDLLARSGAVRDKLVSLVFWVPFGPIGLQTFADLGTALAWLFAPENWLGLATAMPAALRYQPAAWAFVMLLTAALLWGRVRLKPYLASLAPGAVPLPQFRVTHTLGALGITLLIAMPWGLLAWGVGRLLRTAPTAGAFQEAVGTGLAVAGITTLVGQGFVWLLDHRGVAVNHFGWVAEKARAVKRELRRFLLAYVPLVFLAVSTSVSENASIRSSLGRLALMLALVMVSAFWARNLRPEEPFIRRAGGAGVIPRTLARAVYWAGIALPLALALLAAVGYFFAAAALYQLLIMTLLLWLGGVMLYGLVGLWVLVQHARLEQRGDEPNVITGSAEGAIVQRRMLDIASIGGQTRQMLNMMLSLLFLIGLYLIWHGALPALDVVGNVELWRYDDTVDGEKVTRPLTLGGLFLALIVVAATVSAARNIGGMLDAMLLKRLELQADANYAIKTVARYVIAGIGIVAATNLFGISWSSVQWLVAALGVGLGFGLQEIVANFVSGLIVLAERPIRVGDTITVGEVTGNVSRIRARATLITDFDNKEVLIPNKAFITERVVNWTLSSQVTRVLIRVGVAYGTDPARAQEIILAAVRSVPLVLSDPAPSVFFTGFGESALDFEVRVFADGMDRRLPLTHQVNSAIARALADAGIEIPFPQRDLHIRAEVPPLPPAAGRTAEQTRQPPA
jgi:potassium efflux system protein